MPFACPFALCQWRCKPSVSLALSQADEDDASVDGRYPGAGLIYVYVQVESERDCESVRETERAKYLVQVQCVPYCCNVKLSAHSMTHAALAHTHTQRDSHSVSSLVLSRTSPVSFTHAHTMQAAANSPEHICCCCCCFCFELDEEEEEEDEQTSKSKSRRHKSNYNYSGGCPVYRCCCCCCCFPYYRTLCSFCGALQNVAVAPLSLLAASSSSSLFGF